MSGSASAPLAPPNLPHSWGAPTAHGAARRPHPPPATLCWEPHGHGSPAGHEFVGSQPPKSRVLLPRGWAPTLTDTPKSRLGANRPFPATLAPHTASSSPPLQAFPR